MRLTSVLFLTLPALAQTSAPVTATIDINTSITTPLAPNFSGVSADLDVPVEYWDYRFNTLAKTFGFGWLRFPGGTSSDIYNWQTGEDVVAWLNEFPTTSNPGDNTTTPVLVAARGGAHIVDGVNRANFLGAPLIICVNAFTDTPASAGLLAAFVKANNIQVAAWELANEAYLFPTFFAAATDYLNAMLPYRDAIKAVLPDAVVAVFINDQAKSGAATDPWSLAVAAYPNKYWDAITFHDYPSASTGAFSQWMADETAALVNGTGAALISRFSSMGLMPAKFLNTEFDPSIPNPPSGGKSLTDGTVWGGIYSAEYVMRNSTQPAILHVGPSEISNNAGVELTDDNDSTIEAAAAAGATIDTLTLNFGFYLSAQGLGASVLNNVLTDAVQSNQTTLTGGATVPATGMANVPALYAQSYSSAQGGVSLVITNKSATPHQVTVTMDGTAAAGTFALQSVSASDPSTANSSSSPNAVTVQTGSSGNPITIPAYSVISVALSTPPIATFVNSASFQPVPAAPQQLVTAFGNGFATQTIVAPAGQPYPSTLGDTGITITDSKGAAMSAPLYYVSSSQASFLIPSGLAAGTASVKVTRSANTVLTGSLTISSISPAIYSANGNGAGVAAALAASYSSSGAATQLTVFSCQTGVPLSCLSSPMSVASSSGTVYLSLYGTGIRGAKSVQAFVAGQQVTVAGYAAQSQYQGLDQVNIILPASLAGMGEVSVYLIADGVTSNMTTVNIQ